jgi:hypothetical protein
MATNNTTMATATIASNNMDPKDSTAVIATIVTTTTALRDRISLEDSNLALLEELGIKIIIVGYYECS